MADHYQSASSLSSASPSTSSSPLCGSDLLAPRPSPTSDMMTVSPSSSTPRSITLSSLDSNPGTIVQKQQHDCTAENTTTAATSLVSGHVVSRADVRQQQEQLLPVPAHYSAPQNQNHLSVASSARKRPSDEQSCSAAKRLSPHSAATPGFLSHYGPLPYPQPYAHHPFAARPMSMMSCCEPPPHPHMMAPHPAYHGYYMYPPHHGLRSPPMPFYGPGWWPSPHPFAHQVGHPRSHHVSQQPTQPSSVVPQPTLMPVHPPMQQSCAPSFRHHSTQSPGYPPTHLSHPQFSPHQPTLVHHQALTSVQHQPEQPHLTKSHPLGKQQNQSQVPYPSQTNTPQQPLYQQNQPQAEFQSMSKNQTRPQEPLPLPSQPPQNQTNLQLPSPFPPQSPCIFAQPHAPLHVQHHAVGVEHQEHYDSDRPSASFSSSSSGHSPESAAVTTAEQLLQQQPQTQRVAPLPLIGELLTQPTYDFSLGGSSCLQQQLQLVKGATGLIGQGGSSSSSTSDSSSSTASHAAFPLQQPPPQQSIWAVWDTEELRKQLDGDAESAVEDALSVICKLSALDKEEVHQQHQPQL